MTRQTVMVVYGGPSPDHDESVRSARNAYAALDGEKYLVRLIYIDPHGKWWLLNTWSDALDEHGGTQVLIAPATHSIMVIPGNHIVRMDVILPLVHDIVITAALALLDVPMVGASIRTCIITRDERATRAQFVDAGIPVTVAQPERTLLVGLLGKGSRARSSGIGERITDDGKETLLTNIELVPTLHDNVLELAKRAYRTMQARSLGLVVVGLRGKDLTVVSVDTTIDFVATNPWVVLWRAQGLHYPELIEKLIATASREPYTKNT